MNARRSILAAAALALAGCGHVSTSSEPATTTTSPPPTTAAPTTAAVPSPVTTVLAATTVPRPTTSTTRPLSRAEATAKLCAAVAEGDRRVQDGSYVAGALRLGGGISAYEKTADPTVLAATRSMLSSGVRGNVEGYATARTAAAAACARAGSPIQLSGPVQCIQAPCP